VPLHEGLARSGRKVEASQRGCGAKSGQAAQLLGPHRPAITEIETENRKFSAGEVKTSAQLYHVSVE
jgi:hypothetical protein